MTALEDREGNCAICGQPSDELNTEGECPACVDEREEEEAEES
jgi:hypothetical protein